MGDVVFLEIISTGELRPSFLPTGPPEIARLADKCLAVADIIVKQYVDSSAM